MKHGAQTTLHTAEMIAAASDCDDDEGEHQSLLRDDAREGIRFERRVFHAMFATADQKEGTSAFIAKRTPKFEHK